MVLYSIDSIDNTLVNTCRNIIVYSYSGRIVSIPVRRKTAESEGMHILKYLKYRHMTLQKNLLSVYPIIKSTIERALFFTSSLKVSIIDLIISTLAIEKIYLIWTFLISNDSEYFLYSVNCEIQFFAHFS